MLVIPRQSAQRVTPTVRRLGSAEAPRRADDEKLPDGTAVLGMAGSRRGGDLHGALQTAGIDGVGLLRNDGAEHCRWNLP